VYYNCIIAGFGGQGILLIGNILAYGALFEGKRVTYLPVYGVEMRGGTANCTVVISDREIGSPVIRDPVSSIVMNGPSLRKFGPRVKKGGLLLINSSLISDREHRGITHVEKLLIPSSEIASDAGDERLSNMVMLGAYIQKTKIVRLNSIKKALPAALDKRYHHTIPQNLKALTLGADYVKKIL